MCIVRLVSVVAAAVLTFAVPLDAREAVERPLSERYLREYVARTPGQASNLADVTATGGNFFLAWREGTRGADEVRFQMSSDGGRTYGPDPAGRVLARTGSQERIHAIRVVASASDVYLLFTSGVTEDLAQVSLMRSHDGGATFSQPARIERRGGSAFADMALDHSGRLHLVLEDRGESGDIVYLRSDDGGATFGPEMRISETPAESREPRIAARGNDVAVVWWDGGAIPFARSGPDGTFTAARTLSPADSWSPSIAWGDSIHVLWSERSAVSYARSEDGGASFPALAALAAAAGGERLVTPRVVAAGQSVRVSWSAEDPSGLPRGPFLRRSFQNGERFSDAEDLSAEIGGAALGAVAIIPASSDHIVFPHSPTRLTPDSDVLRVQSNAVPCDYEWKDPISGDWGEAAKWKTGVVPPIAANVCIIADGIYTVTVNAFRRVNALQVGNANNLVGQPTLVLNAAFDVDFDFLNDGHVRMGVFTLTVGTPQTAPAPRLGIFRNNANATFTTFNAGNRIFDSDLVNDGTFTIASNRLTIQSNPSRLTNNGTFNIGPTGDLLMGVNGRFLQNGGTLSIDPAGQFQLDALFADGGDSFEYNGGNVSGTVRITGHSQLVLADTAGSSGTFLFRASGTTSRLYGNVKAGQHLQIIAEAGNASVTPQGPFSSAGTITFDSTATASSIAQMDIQAGTFTNTGTIEVGNASLNSTKLIRGGTLVNNGGVINIRDDFQITGTNNTFTNSGNVTVFSPAKVTLGNGTVINHNGGVFDVRGVVELASGGNQGPDHFLFNGGTIEGEIQLRNPCRLQINTTGKGRFLFHMNDNLPGSSLVTGDISADQTVIVRAENATNGHMTVQFEAGFENRGSLILESAAGATGAAEIQPLGAFTNHHVFEIRSDGNPDDASRRLVRGGSIVNHGTFTIADHTQLTGTANSITNEGTVSISAGAKVTLGNGTQVQQNKGAINIAGSLWLETGSNQGPDRFDYNGGTVNGTVFVNQFCHLHIDPAAAGGGTFIYGIGSIAFVGGGTFSGTIGQAQTVIVRAQTVNGGGGVLTAPDGMVNKGTLILDATGTTGTGSQVNVTNGTLTNIGTIQVAATNPLATYSITANIDNYGTISIDDDVSITGTNRTLTNRGTIRVAAGRGVSFGNTHVLHQLAGLIDVDGTLTLATGGNEGPDTFNFHGGTVDGRITLLNNSILNIGAGSTGAAEFLFGASAATMSGNVAQAQTITLRGTSAGTAQVTVANGFSNAGTILLDSDATTTNGAILNVTAGTLLNTGTLTLGNANLASFKTLNASVDNRGRFDILDSTTLAKTSASYANSGVMKIDAGQTLTVGGSGTVTNPGGTIEGGGTLILQNLSTFVGAGNLTLALFRNEGRLFPGGSPGILNIHGTYTQTATGALNVEIGGATPGLYDQVNVTGAATLAGTLNASLFGTYCPEGSFTILTGNPVSGDFTTRNLTVTGGRSFLRTVHPGSYVLTTSGPRCNEAPVAFADAYDAIAGMPLTIAAPGVLGNDTDSHNDPLTAILVTGALHGTVVLNPNGSFTYTPPAAFVATDEFTYKVRDVPPAGATQMDSNPALVTITLIDPIAPVTLATVTPAPHANGWNRESVDVTLTAADNIGGSGLKQVRYSIDGGAEVISQSASTTFPLAAQGIHSIRFFATDNAGNEEILQTLLVRIDTTAPLITPPANLSRTTTTDCGVVVSDADLGLATATDNLSAVTITRAGVPSGNVFPVGTTTLTYTATDEAGNTSSASQTVIVTDDTDPTIQAPPDVAVSAEPGATSCGAVIPDATLGAATATDNCANVTVTRSGVPVGNLFPAGTTILTYTVTDAAGNTSTDTQSVTVSDQTAPAIQAPASITVPTDASSCSAMVNVPVTATDNCDSSVTITHDGPANHLFPLGATTVTYTATDDAGNTRTATVVVTVEDRTAPAIQASPAITVPTEANACSASVSPVVTATDRCDSSVTITHDGPSNGIFPLGATTVTYTGTDDAGNTSTATVIVTVEDRTAPLIQAPANVSVSADAGACSAAVNAAVNATDLCDASVSITHDGPANNIYPVGTTTVTYTATDDAGNSSTATVTVTVEDESAPSIQVPANLTVAADANACSATVNPVVTANDTCDPSVTITHDGPADNRFSLGTTTVTYTATDDAGNSSTATVTITVQDRTAPSIQAPASLTVPAAANSCSATVNPLATASDGCDTSVTVTHDGPANGVFPLGTTTVTYTATDDAGNSSTATVTVTVEDKTAPSLQMPANIRVSAPPNACSATVAPVVTATDSCDSSVTITHDGPAGNVFPVGTTTVTYTATDDASNSSTATLIVTILDSEAPAISNAAAEPSALTPADGRMVDVAVSYQLTDACGGATAILSAVSSDPDTGAPDIEVVSASLIRLRAEVASGASERRYTITITATDGAGNASTSNLVVTVAGGTVIVTPLTILLQVETEVDRLLRERRDRKGAEHLDKALKDVRSAIEHLRRSPKNRGCAANAIKNAVQALEHAAKGGAISDSEALALMRLLTEASRMLAMESLEIATAAGTKTDVAERNFADGDAARAALDYRRAVQEYKTTIDTLENGSCKN